MQSKIGTGLVLAVAALLLLAAAGTLCAQETAAENGQADSANAVSADPGREELESMIGAAVAMRLRPLVREIRDLKDEIRLHDILGGIGYIVGLAGVAFYFLGTRKRGRLRAKDGNGL